MRILPPIYKTLISYGEPIRPTWLQRLQIAVGYTVVVKFKARCRYSPGPWDPQLTLETTKQIPKKEGL